ncbi:putative neutral amino acid permease [Diplodia seriata]|uniref:Putative neutral amino acid permease n=1 Tax=Diplodia seriata TaxID=420778 RepID=A0A0G2EXU3_9PEZI|nr:putative neutral amino acid permease [Diplodia seriata]
MSDWSDISDPELRKWWEGAATKYYSEVKREPNTADAMSIDGLLASLYGDGVDDHHKGNQKKTRAYLNNILTTIQNMGAFVSSATSNAFQASDICLNAVCYLVKAAKDYHAYFASIGDLFEAILPFLMRFDVYARDKYKFVELDGHVKSIIFKLLKCFMEICNISSRITKEKASKWGKLRVAAKVLAYQDDGGVKDKLNKIQNLVSQELSMDVAVILKSVKLTENGVVELRTDMTKIKEDVGSVNSTVKSFDGRFTEAQKREEEERVKNTNRQTIMNVLDIKDGKRPWVDAQQKHLTNALQGTGAWLISDPDFQKWANAKGGTFSAVLAFRANAKCGKTYLCSQAIDRLQEICRNRADDAGSVQTHLAYYFIEEKDEDRMSKALRTIIWQLTESDIVFQKHVAAKCAGREYFPNLEDMWKSTMMTFKPVAQRREYIIVLDGIDNVVGSDQRHKKHPLSGRLNDIDLLKYQKVNLKFLITGKETILRGLEWESDAAFTYVDVVSKSEADIRRYIDNRLGAVSQDWSATGETQQLKKKVGETLLQASKGDYYKLDSLFNDISSQNDLDGIESVLKRAGESRKEATARHLRRLNKDLNDEDIKDFNEILPSLGQAKE